MSAQEQTHSFDTVDESEEKYRVIGRRVRIDLGQPTLSNPRFSDWLYTIESPESLLGTRVKQLDDKQFEIMGLGIRLRATQRCPRYYPAQGSGPIAERSEGDSNA